MTSFTDVTKCFSSLVLVFLSISLFAQPKEFSLSDKTYDPFTNELILELNKEVLDVEYTAEYYVSKISDPDHLMEVIGSERVPGVYRFRWIEFKPGKYTVVIKHGEQVSHKVTFKVKAPKPEPQIAIKQNGQNTGNRLNIDYRTPLEANLEITGGPYFEAPEVSLQGIKLPVEKINDQALLVTIDWRNDQLANLKLGNQKLKISHEDYGDVYSDIYLSGTAPKLSDVRNIEYTDKQSQITLEFAGSLISPNALICTSCIGNSKCYVESNCFLMNKADIAGRYKVSLGLYLPESVDQTRFYAYIKNGDGQMSDSLIVQVRKSNSTLTIKPKNEAQGVISGMPVDIVLECTDADFELNHFEEYQLYVQSKPAKIQINQSISTFKQIFATVIIPEKVKGKDVNFLLAKDDKNWTGKLDVKALPRLVHRGDYFRNQSYQLSYNSQVAGANISTDSPGVILDDTDVSDGSGKVSLQAHAPDRIFLQFKIQDFVVRYDTLQVRQWYDPQNSIVFPDTTIFKHHRGNTYLYLNKNQKLELLPAEPLVRANTYQQLKVQLYNNSGAAIGNTETVYFNSAEGLSLDTYGLNEGDVFRLEVKTLDNKRFNYTGYVKRNFTNRWIVSAGINGIRYELRDDGDPETIRYSMLKGVTAGAYYLFDPMSPSTTRFIGVGPYANFIENEAGNDIKMTLGIGVLIKERLMIGYDFSSTNAITIGATMNILDFTKLTGD